MQYVTTEIGSDVADLVAGNITDRDYAESVIFQLAVQSARDKETAHSIGELAGHCGTLTEDCCPYKEPQLAISFTSGFHQGETIREWNAEPAPAAPPPPAVYRHETSHLELMEDYHDQFWFASGTLALIAGALYVSLVVSPI